MYNASTLSLFNIRTFRLSFNLKFFWIIVFSLTLFLIIFCVFQLNAYTKEYYLSQNGEKELNQLTQENRNLEINFSNINSLNNIDKHVQNFKKINKIEYIRILEGTALVK